MKWLKQRYQNLEIRKRFNYHMRYFIALFFSLNIFAYDAFLKPSELKNLLQSDALVLLDVSSLSSYEKSHITGAYHVPISEFIKSKNTRLATSFSTKVATEMKNLGINRDSHVVIYSRTNSDDFANALYLAFIFIQHGFENVSLLDGGYLAWVFENYNDVSSTKSKPLHKGNFEATYNPKFLVEKSKTENALALLPSKGAGKIFFDDLTLKSKEELKEVLSSELRHGDADVALYGVDSFSLYANWYILYKLFDLKNIKMDAESLK